MTTSLLALLLLLPSTAFVGAAAGGARFPWVTGLYMRASAVDEQVWLSRSAEVFVPRPMVGVTAAVVADVYTCTAALLEPRVVLTAAHCLEMNMDNWVDSASVAVVDPAGKRPMPRSVLAAWVHPAYDRATRSDDVALLLLDRPVSVSRTVALPPVALPPKPGTVPKTLTVVKVGAGPTTVRTTSCDPLFDLQVDPDVYRHRASKYFCAGNRTHTVCGDDDGAPLVVPGAKKDVVHGVVIGTEVECEGSPPRLPRNLPFAAANIGGANGSVGWISATAKALRALADPVARRARCMSELRARLSRALAACDGGAAKGMCEPALVSAACGGVAYIGAGADLDAVANRAVWAWARCRCRAAFVDAGAWFAAGVLDALRDFDVYVCRHPSDAAKLDAGVRRAIGDAWDVLALNRTCATTTVNLFALVDRELSKHCLKTR